MHYTTCAMVLAAGSSIASTSAQEIFDSKVLKRAVKAPIIMGKGPVHIVTNMGANKQPAKPLSRVAPVSIPDDPDVAAAKRAAKQAAAYMTEYQTIHPPRKGQSLADDVPPPMNFQMSTYTGAVTSNNYQGAVTNNDNRVSATGGSTVATGGSKVDQSMNDNRQQVAPGATLNGNAYGNRNFRREFTQPLVEENTLAALVRAMRRDPEAKEEVLYEIAGIPGFRAMVEVQIQKYTDTDGQLTMNNFAALESAMFYDKDVSKDVLVEFNAIRLYAAMVYSWTLKYAQYPLDYDEQRSRSAEKQLKKKKAKAANKKSSSKKSSSRKSKYVSDDDNFWVSGSSQRNYDNEYYDWVRRSIEEDYLPILARDVYDPELFW